MATIKDIAKASGVSVATVSRVLNHDSKVSPKTYEKVNQIIKSENYSPNMLGRNLRLNKTKTVLVLLNTISNSFFSRIVGSMERIAHENSYNIMIATTGGQIEQEHKYVKMLEMHLFDGAIFTATKFSARTLDKHSSAYPIVQCSEYVDYNQSTPFVSIDNKKAAFDATNVLINNGHSSIGLILGDKSLVSTQLRLEGYKQALYDAKIKYNKRLITYGDYGFSSGERTASLLIELNPSITSVFATSDHMAGGAMRAAKKKGLSVPGDFSIMGFDNVRLSRFLDPQLSTVAQPQEELGAAAMKMLLERINGECTQSDKVFLPHSIIERESTLVNHCTTDA